VAFAAAHAAGRPQSAIPQKSKLESLNSGIANFACRAKFSYRWVATNFLLAFCFGVLYDRDNQ
jgi:hypothetical protein